MERILQYFDDLDDLVCACGLLVERVRRLVLFAVSALLFLGFLIGSVLLAFAEPPLGLAIVTMLAVIFMFHSITTPARKLLSH